MKNLHPPCATSSLAVWLYYLRNLHSQAIELDIVRITCVANTLNLLKPAPFVFIVAGTNGKGTTCCVLETLLLAAGYRVGVYNSPHLLHYTERVRIQGIELPEAAHTSSFADIETRRGNTALTCFEFSTLSALQLFKQASLDVVILEVGLGGRLDATNIVDSDIAVITNIALDHINWLGPDRESIGREKAGIFRAGKSAVIGESDMPYSITHVAQEIGTRLLKLNHDWQWKMQERGWKFSDNRITLENLPVPQVPIPNAATALAALSASGLKINETIIRQNLDKAILPGRFQIVGYSPKVILDVAHNPHAATYLSKRLVELQKKGIVHAVVGMLHDKDIAGTLASLASQVDNWYLASLRCPRGASAEQLLLVLKSDQVRTFTSVSSAWRMAIQKADKNDIVLVFGSFHTVANVMKEIKDGER